MRLMSEPLIKPALLCADTRSDQECPPLHSSCPFEQFDGFVCLMRDQEKVRTSAFLCHENTHSAATAVPQWCHSGSPAERTISAVALLLHGQWRAETSMGGTTTAIEARMSSAAGEAREQRI